ncbi:MAG TPA: bifunctional glutamate N-acetyltransferase/amino-acid acetyltransferase ArgJ, partial [Desulfopila sp.]|nr:bifunctional glutamate N-acetyltransferase/amino-acid acetyltransferase ArgJ [Desulfopila sp.]
MRIEGFSSAAIAAGIKYEDRLDLGLIYSEEPAVSAGVFTTSQVVAAPLVLDMSRLKQGRAQAILVNSGCANACTGEEGMKNCQTVSRLVAERLQIDEGMVQLASTGVIGEQLNVEAFEKSVPQLVDGLGDDNFEAVAEAIMTTDTCKKTVSRSVEIGGKTISFMAMAKGSGMIMPNMATMLAFVITDAQIGYVELNDALKKAVDVTFNRITVDGDTSTNDMVLIMANGRAGNPWIEEIDSPDHTLFCSCLESMLKELALMIVEDGEGATKMITVRVCGAREQQEALQIARTVANSSLVKTAFFGEDANWGRIFAAIGRAGVKFNPDKVDIFFDDVLIVENGVATTKEAEAAASDILKNRKIQLAIELKEGGACEEVYTCDFSLDYV